MFLFIHFPNTGYQAQSLCLNEESVNTSSPARSIASGGGNVATMPG